MERQDVSVIRKVLKYLLQNLCSVLKVTEGYYYGLGGNEISLIIFAFHILILPKTLSHFRQKG